MDPLGNENQGTCHIKNLASPAALAPARLFHRALAVLQGKRVGTREGGKCVVVPGRSCLWRAPKLPNSKPSARERARDLLATKTLGCPFSDFLLKLNFCCGLESKN